MKAALALAIIGIALLLAFSGCIQFHYLAPDSGNEGVPQPPGLPDTGQEDGTENAGGETIPQPPALPD